MVSFRGPELSSSSFENYDIAHAPLRTTDFGQADYQLLIDIRRFRVATDDEPRAEIGLSARIVDKNGRVIASRNIETSVFGRRVPAHGLVVPRGQPAVDGQVLCRM